MACAHTASHTAKYLQQNRKSTAVTSTGYNFLSNVLFSPNE
nr:hypothetical protein Iba_chr10cCG7180 [Ipomoea batatas]